MTDSVKVSEEARMDPPTISEIAMDTFARHAGFKNIDDLTRKAALQIDAALTTQQAGEE